MVRRLAVLMALVLAILCIVLAAMAPPPPVTGFTCTTDHINISSIHCK